MFFTSCNKDLDKIGLDLIDNRLKISVDTVLPLAAYTQLEDSLVTSQAERALLGYYSDPVFGATKASIFAEGIPRNIPFNIADENLSSALTVDSVVLSLAYSGYFGDLNTEHNIKVYELHDTVPAGRVFSNRVLTASPQPMHESSFLPLPNDTVVIIRGADTTNYLPHLRLRLSESVGRKFIDAQEQTSGFTSNDEFRGFFKGFHITVEETAGTGSMLYFNLASGLSRMQIFYKVSNDTIQRTWELPLYDPLARRYTHFNNMGLEGVSEEITKQVIEGDTMAGENRIFVQAMSKFRSKIILPSPEELLGEGKENVAINSAKLVLPVDKDFLEDTLAIASNLVLLHGSETEGEFHNLQDIALGSSYFGGTLNSEGTEYYFNITQHLQMVIDGHIPNFPLYLRVANSHQNAGRAVLKGTGRDNPLRLEIKFTEPLK